MICTPTKPIRRAPIPAPARTTDTEGSRDIRHDPAVLGATLRDIAARAHRAVRALDATSVRGDTSAPVVEPHQELADLHPRIVQLQRCVDAESQSGLASYLSALRREVESRLG
jgi:hypothetical protein